MAALVEGDEARSEDGLGMGAAPGAIAAPDLSVHDGRAYRLLGSPVRRVDRRIDQEPEPLHRVFQNVFRQLAIAVIRKRAGGEMFQLARERQTRLSQLVAAESMSAPRTAQRERPVEQRQHGDEPRTVGGRQRRDSTETWDMPSILAKSQSVAPQRQVDDRVDRI